jgi:uncharacterized damage-inducible protein DinB
MNARDLFAQMEWADAEVWRAARAIPSAFDDERLLRLFMHLHAVQHAFLGMWHGTPADPAQLYAQRTPDELQHFARSYYPQAHAFLDAAEPRHAETVQMPWLAHFERQLGRSLHQPTLDETLTQVPMHGAYHRGQINTRIRELGGEPPLVDFIAWIWFGKPEPNWR